MVIPACGIIFQIFYEDQTLKSKVYEVNGKYAFFHRFFYDYSELVEKIYKGDSMASEELQKIISESLSTELKQAQPPHEFFVAKEDNIVYFYYYIWNNDNEDSSIIHEPSSTSSHVVLENITAQVTEGRFVNPKDFEILRYLEEHILSH